MLAVGRRAEAVREALVEVGAPVDTPDRATGGQCRVVALDIAARSAWQAAREADEARGMPWPPLAGAVLTAGGWRGGSPLHETDDATWEAMLEMNLQTARGSLAGLLPVLVAQGSGSVVVVGSRAAVRPWESSGAAAYAAAKAALVALASAVATEVLERGVRVNVVLPSTIDTPDNRAAMPHADHSRWVDTKSLSDVIAFLLSDAARDVSGAALPVYGRA